MIIKNEEYLSFVESQRYFCIGRTTIQRAVSNGKIAYYRIGKKKMLSKKDLEEFIDSFFVDKRKNKGRPRKNKKY